MSAADRVKALGTVSLAEQLLITGLVKFEEALAGCEAAINEHTRRLAAAKALRAEYLDEIEKLKRSLSTVSASQHMRTNDR